MQQQLEMAHPVVLRSGQEGEILGLDTDKAILFSNSERSAMACPSKWWFRYGQSLKSPPTAPMSLGKAWHSCMEDMARYWVANGGDDYPRTGFWTCAWCQGAGGDCEHCAGTGEGPVPRIVARWISDQAAMDSPLVEQEEIDEMAKKLSRMCEGYVQRYGTASPGSYDIVAVEANVARPVLSPITGKPYRPAVPIVDTPTGPRFARSEDSEEAIKWVRWPWYQLGILDAIGRDRSSGRLMVIERKSSGQPSSLVGNLTVDPQTTGYTWLLDGAARAGVFGDAVATMLRPVMGWMYQIAVTHLQQDPKRLKKGGLSKAKNARVPSWRFRAAVRQDGLDEADYADYIHDLTQRVDPSLYIDEFGMVGPTDLARYATEIHAVAQRLAQARRDAYRAKDSSSVIQKFPRVPVCTAPGSSCAYRGLCVSDSPQGRSSFEQGEGALWWAARKVETPAVQPEDDSGDYPDFDPDLGF